MKEQVKNTPRFPDSGVLKTRCERAEHNLSERMKELRCVYDIADIIERPGITLDKIYQAIVDILPRAWQYPEITCARITIEYKQFKTENWRNTDWKQSSDIMVDGVKKGRLDVCYLKERPKLYEGPFLKEERKIIDVVTERLGRATERIKGHELILKAKEFTDNVITSIQAGLCILDIDGTHLHINPALCKLTGFSRNEVIGMKYPYPYCPPEVYEVTKRAFQRGLADKIHDIELILMRKNGERFPAFISPAWIKDKQGNVIACSVIVRDITEQASHRDNMHSYVSEIIKAQEDERKRIACELHDDIAQRLAGLCFHFEEFSALSESLPDKAHKQLESIQHEVNAISEQLRDFSYNLTPMLINELGLILGLEQLVMDVNSKTHINFSFQSPSLKNQISSEVELMLYRIAQEAIRNIMKHSGATRASIEIEFTMGKIKMTIADNGVGMELPKMLSNLVKKKKLGLFGIEQRSMLVNGELSLQSNLGEGTILTVDVPV